MTTEEVADGRVAESGHGSADGTADMAAGVVASRIDAATGQSGLLRGRRAVITGGGNGIGAAIAKCFADAGATGVVLDLPAAVAAAKPPPGWYGVEVDVRDEASMAAAMNRSRDLLGHVDAVVAAAGVVPDWAVPAEMDLADFDRVMAVNARGVANTIKHAIPVLVGEATITVVASLNAWRGDPNITSYAASKHAALGIMRSSALALGSRGIRVNAVAPGPIATPALLARMRSRSGRTGLDEQAALENAAAGTALGRIATATEVAQAVLFLTSGLSSGMTGQMLNVDCGIS